MAEVGRMALEGLLRVVGISPRLAAMTRLVEMVLIVPSMGRPSVGWRRRMTVSPR
jgi:hypothetical protein